MTPEVRLAQRVLKRFKLSPPVDVLSIIARYADLKRLDIPIEGVDGICLNLKVPGVRPTVIINSRNAKLRQRFTEAHELGHILIPWHMGSIVDYLDYEAGMEVGYLDIEGEANSFAAEILMPSDWISAVVQGHEDLAQCHYETSSQCKVSHLASARKLSEELPANIAFASERNGQIEFSGKSPGTLCRIPAWNQRFEPDLFAYADKHYELKVDNRTLHWWRLPAGVTVDIDDDDREWREILSDILADIEIPDGDIDQEKRSINGIVASANSLVIRAGGKHTKEKIVAACMQRFHGRPELKAFVEHVDFMIFLAKRAADLARD